MRTAIITGADGDMGIEITKAVAKAGFKTIMACLPTKNANDKFTAIKKETNGGIVLLPIELENPETIYNFVEKVKRDFGAVDLLINNAGVLYPKKKDMDEKWDYTTMVNYFGHYLLTIKLLPFFKDNGRIINVISLTYRFGSIYPEMFQCGRNSWLQQVRNYSNAKLALLYFSLDLAEQLKERNITVNCSDPGIVGTNIIAMNNQFFDKICDIFARPFMKSHKNGAKTAIYLALNENVSKITGGYFRNEKQTPVIKRFLQNNYAELLKIFTEKLIIERNITL
ncbi:MAG: SDR family NAD(P)-dependent oxidoreductase [Bacteroidales bacterium]|jgi:NAD(P)-dependent dehydrogenase (short-subunit alcohol dehydrogenase family)|nr:SDR family NAD(P)-dependent oxidoreductase [Bacteroidales bacterium]